MKTISLRGFSSGQRLVPGQQEQPVPQIGKPTQPAPPASDVPAPAPTLFGKPIPKVAFPPQKASVDLKTVSEAIAQAKVQTGEMEPPRTEPRPDRFEGHDLSEVSHAINDSMEENDPSGED
jgi:hypothetical protein